MEESTKAIDNSLAGPLHFEFEFEFAHLVLSERDFKHSIGQVLLLVWQSNILA